MVLLAIAGWIGVALGVAGLVLRWSDPRRQLLIVAASGAYLLAALPVVGLVLLAIGQQWLGAVVASVVVAVGLSTYAPWWVRSRPLRDGVAVRVMTQNLLLGGADADQVVAAVVRHEVDVLLLQELTPAAQERLLAAGLERTLPHRWSQPDHSAFGAGIWSRFALGATRVHPDFVTATLSAEATFPDGSTMTLVCAHPPAPWPRPPAPWRADLALLRDFLAEIPVGPVVVAGDFNSTVDHTPFRRVLAVGYRDAAGQAGAGLPRTWPADRRTPPVIGIDHVLTRGAVATSVRTVRIAGTDHRGLLATVVVPR